MKLSFKALGFVLLSGASFYISSCDSEEQSSATDPLTSPNAVTQSLTPEEVRGDGTLGSSDTLRYVTEDPSPVISTVFPLAGVRTEFVGETFVYNKTGNHSFTLTLERNAGSRVEAATQTLLGNPTELGSEFRRRLLNPNQEFSREDLEFFVTAYRPLGAPIQVDPSSGSFFFETGTTHTHLVTSTNEDRQNGSMGGRYVVDASGIVMTFRPVTLGEVEAFRLTTNHVIPVIGSESIFFEKIEEGTFTLDLTNNP